MKMKVTIIKQTKYVEWDKIENNTVCVDEAGMYYFKDRNNNCLVFSGEYLFLYTGEKADSFKQIGEIKELHMVVESQ